MKITDLAISKKDLMKEFESGLLSDENLNYLLDRVLDQPDSYDCDEKL